MTKYIHITARSPFLSTDEIICKSKAVKRLIDIRDGFNRLNKRKSYLRIAQIGRISRDIVFNGNTWVYELYRTTRKES